MTVLGLPRLHSSLQGQILRRRRMGRQTVRSTLPSLSSGIDGHRRSGLPFAARNVAMAYWSGERLSDLGTFMVA